MLVVFCGFCWFFVGFLFIFIFLMKINFCCSDFACFFGLKKKKDLDRCVAFSFCTVYCRTFILI